MSEFQHHGKHVVIGGGTGFIGSALKQALEARGDRVTVISRRSGPAGASGRMTWNELARDGLPQCDAVVNFAGQHILNLRRRSNDSYRDEVIGSRVETTQALVNAINASAQPPSVFVSTAGKCFYGTKELAAGESHPELDEFSEPMGRDFPAELVSLWERAAEGVDAARVRHVQLRIGVVLGAVERRSLLGRLWRIGHGRGFLPMIRLPFCLGGGAMLGDGRQMLPWIHIDDMVALIVRALDHPAMAGRYNGVSPGIVTHRAFIETFAKKLRRKARWNAPAWLVERVVGAERSSILLRGQLVRPRRTLEAGFRFKFETIEAALDDLVKVTI